VRTYETTFVINPQSDDAVIDQQVNAITKIITDNGGSIHHENRMGTRRLAYPILGLAQGYYTSLIYDGETVIPPQLDKYFKLEEPYIRYLTICYEGPIPTTEEEVEKETEGKPADKPAVAKPEKKPEAKTEAPAEEVKTEAPAETTPEPVAEEAPAVETPVEAETPAETTPEPVAEEAPAEAEAPAKEAPVEEAPAETKPPEADEKEML